MAVMAAWGFEEYREKGESVAVQNAQVTGYPTSKEDERAKMTIEEETIASEAAQQEDEGNFRQIGTLINYDAETEKEGDDWRLLYDKPGASVRQVELIIDEDSGCKKIGIVIICTDVQFGNGDRGLVLGQLTDDGVRVDSIRRVE